MAEFNNLAEIAKYECIRGCVWETTEGRFSPFESRPCPKCGCASSLKTVVSTQRFNRELNHG